MCSTQDKLKIKLKFNLYLDILLFFLFNKKAFSIRNVFKKSFCWLLQQRKSSIRNPISIFKILTIFDSYLILKKLFLPRCDEIYVSDNLNGLYYFPLRCLGDCASQWEFYPVKYIKTFNFSPFTRRKIVIRSRKVFSFRFVMCLIF